MGIGGKILTYFKGEWHKGNIPIMGSADHASWLGSSVFDGSRQFDGVRPDLILNCERLINSARALGLTPKVTAQELFEITEEGCKMFAPDAEIYIRPMMWAKDGSPGMIDVDPLSAEFCICLEELPLPEVGTLSLTVSEYRRPRQDTALTEAKAGALYPNNARIIADARKRGFSNALSLDLDGNVAETASTNIFMIKDGEVWTPNPNGTFLNGLNRQRIIKLLKADGVKVHEVTMKLADFETADEIFTTGNASKVMPVVRYQDREFADYSQTMRIRQLYWDFALSS